MPTRWTLARQPSDVWCACAVAGCRCACTRQDSACTSTDRGSARNSGCVCCSRFYRTARICVARPCCPHVRTVATPCSTSYLEQKDNRFIHWLYGPACFIYYPVWVSSLGNTRNFMAINLVWTQLTKINLLVHDTRVCDFTRHTNYPQKTKQTILLTLV